MKVRLMKTETAKKKDRSTFRNQMNVVRIHTGRYEQQNKTTKSKTHHTVRSAPSEKSKHGI